MNLEARIKGFRLLGKDLSKTSFTVSKTKEGKHTIKLFRKYRLFDCADYDTASAIRDRLNNVLKSEADKISDILKCLEVRCEQLSFFAKEDTLVVESPTDPDEAPVEGVTIEEALADAGVE